MTANNGDVEVLGVLLASNLSNEGLGTDDVECSDTEQLLGVEDTSGLEDLGGDGNCGVDGVGDDENVSFWGYTCYRSGKVTDDGGVSLAGGVSDG